MPTLEDYAKHAVFLRKHAEFVASENDGEICEELAQSLTMSEEALEAKVGACIFIMRELAAEAKQNAELAAHYNARALSLAGQRNRLQTWVEYNLTANGLEKMVTAAGNAWFQGNGGSAPLLLDDAYKTDPAKLPAEYQKVTIAPDNAAIKAALEAGVQLPFATIGERGKSLRIK